MTADHSASDLRTRLDWSDAQLLRECEVHTYRASGPGGQHRNKTSSAVRLHHGPSGLIMPATERRSQHQNKARALKRLREALAVGFRCKLPDQIDWPDGSPIVGGRLQVGKRSPHRFHILAIVLDVLAEKAGRLRESAECLGASGSSLTAFLADYPKAWAEANRIRDKAGLSPLRR